MDIMLTTPIMHEAFGQTQPQSQRQTHPDDANHAIVVTTPTGTPASMNVNSPPDFNLRVETLSGRVYVIKTDNIRTVESDTDQDAATSGSEDEPTPERESSDDESHTRSRERLTIRHLKFSLRQLDPEARSLLDKATRGPSDQPQPNVDRAAISVVVDANAGDDSSTVEDWLFVDSDSSPLSDDTLLKLLPQGTCLQYRMRYYPSYTTLLRRTLFNYLNVPNSLKWSQMNGHARMIVLVFEIVLLGCAALFLSSCAQISFQLPNSWSTTVQSAKPIPITFQTFGVLLLGALLGAWRGVAACSIYVLYIVMGAPFAATQSGGYELIANTTGGFLIGFIFCALIIGYLTEKGWDRSWYSTTGSMILGHLIIYTFGLVWLPFGIAHAKGISVHSAVCGYGHGCVGNVFWFGMVPFLPGDAIKLGMVVILLPLGWKLFAWTSKQEQIQLKPFVLMKQSSNSTTSSTNL